MHKQRSYFFVTLLFLLFSILHTSCDNAEPQDLTEFIVGVYDGTVSLYLDTDSTLDVANQTVEIRKVDDNNIEIIIQTYPNSSPVAGKTFTAILTRTPFGFIRTEGVMLTIDPLDPSEGMITGTPYLVQGGDREAHGSYDQAKGELVFALEVSRNGVLEYELFSGIKR